MKKRLAQMRLRLRNYLLGRQNYRFFLKTLTQPPDVDACLEAIHLMRPARLIAPRLETGPASDRILVLVPHPDDEAMGPGGVLIQAARAGAEILLVYMTSGGRGPELDALRRQEAETAAATLGARTHFFPFKSFGVPLDDPTLEQLSGLIAAFDPGALFLPLLTDDHDDHRRLSHLLFEARQRGHLNAKLNPEVWAYAVYHPAPANVIVDISATADEKERLIRAYASELEKFDWAHWTLGLNAFNTRLMKPYMRPGAPQPRHVETFLVAPLDGYLEFCDAFFRRGNSAVYTGGAYR